ncbi:hypothetical protein LV779_15485 [Streptomyces thinghirensis]|nr:hypothetical protein [Streptomyces thinghirensis]
MGSEFVTTSITSGGDGSATHDPGQVYWDENPHTKYYSSRRGYVRRSASRDRYTADYRVVDYVTRPGVPVRTDSRSSSRRACRESRTPETSIRNQQSPTG